MNSEDDTFKILRKVEYSRVLDIINEYYHNLPNVEMMSNAEWSRLADEKVRDYGWTIKEFLDVAILEFRN